VSRIGALELEATCSIRSISRLNAGLRVSMPDLRIDAASCGSRANREAERSYLDRSRSMMLNIPGSAERRRLGGEVWISSAGLATRLGKEEETDLCDVRTGRDVHQVVFFLRVEGIRTGEVMKCGKDLFEVPGVADLHLLAPTSV
jgi:hypothetical protein